LEFDNPYGTLRPYVILHNDPEDFAIPYDTPSEVDRESMEWKYHRLNNLPSHIYQVRVGDTPIFGKGGMAYG
jgi:hypothetical protein